MEAATATLVLGAVAAAFVLGALWARRRGVPPPPGRVARRLAAVERALDRLAARGGVMASVLEELRAEVARNTEVDASASVLLDGLTAKIQQLIDAAGDSVPAGELQAFVDELRGSTDGLAAAVAANTPGA